MECTLRRTRKKWGDGEKKKTKEGEIGEENRRTEKIKKEESGTVPVRKSERKKD